MSERGRGRVGGVIVIVNEIEIQRCFIEHKNYHAVLYISYLPF